MQKELKVQKPLLQRTCDCLHKMSFPKERNMKTTTNNAEKKGQLSLGVAIFSQVKLLILFTVDLSRALNHRFYCDLNLVKVMLAYVSAQDGKTSSCFGRSVKCSGNTPEAEPAGPFAPLWQPGPPCPRPVAGLTARHRREGQRTATSAEAVQPAAPQPDRHPAARAHGQQAWTSRPQFARGTLN